MNRTLRRFKPLEYAVGTDGEIVIELLDNAGKDLGIVGATAEWKVFEAVPRRRRKPFKGTAKLTKTSVAGQIALVTGKATVTITDTDLAGFSGEHWHVIRLTDSSGNITHLGQGAIHLRAEA